MAEENDPTALAQQSSPADAIEPISQGRLDLYKGVTTTGTSGGIGGYFLDPSCAYLSGTAACGTGSVSGDTWITNSVSPAVTPISTGTPAGIGGAGLFDPDPAAVPVRPERRYCLDHSVPEPGYRELAEHLVLRPVHCGAGGCS